MRMTKNGMQTDSLHFFYDAGGKPSIVEFNGTKYAYVQDLQGDVCQIIDENGHVVVEYTYDAWGKVLSTIGSMANTLGLIQPFRYRGYVYDVETGLYYLRSRYYNPEWQRFLNADAIIEANIYVYCNNCPVMCADTTGFYTEYPETYINALQAIYNYSIENKDNPKCIDSDEFLRRCEKFVGRFSYDTCQCAASIARNLEHGMSYTGMTTMFENNILEGTKMYIKEPLI